MLLALALSLFVSSGNPPPAIRIKLSDDVFARGERARVHIKTEESGYLVVLRADAQGRIRVLFPLDPTDTGVVKAGREYEIRGRGDRDAFTVDDREGSGKVLAAISPQPFQFDAFMRGGHWDYSALASQDSSRDAEAALLDVVSRMVDSGQSYDYDLATYTVTERSTHRGYAASRWGGWGWGGWGLYDPFVGCWSCRPWFYGPHIGFGTTILVGRPHYLGVRRR